LYETYIRPQRYRRHSGSATKLKVGLKIQEQVVDKFNSNRYEKDQNKTKKNKKQTQLMPTCFFPGTDNYDVYTQLFCLFRFRTTAYLCDLLATVQRRKLPYFGHVARARNRCTEILEGRLDGKRRRSRPMRRCRDDIKGWSNRSVAECSRLAIERQATMKTTGARATT